MPDIDMAGITLADLKDLEREIGRPIGALFAALSGGEGLEGLDLDMLVGLVWLRMRRDHPGLELKEVYAIDLGEITALVAGAGEPDPFPRHSGGPRA